MKTILISILSIIIFSGCGKKERHEQKDPVPEQATAEAKEQPAVKPDAPAKEKQVEKPKTFEESLIVIRELEENAEFSEAIRICRSALAETTDPDRTEILGRIMQRLVLSQNEALELSFAVRNLAESKDRSLEVARQKLRESGETGRILLRKAVREGNETSVREAGAILVDLEDKYVPTVFVERLRTNPPGPVLKALIQVLRESKQELDYGLIAELCESAQEESPTRLILMNIIMDSLEQSVTLSPAENGSETEEEEEAAPDLKKLPAQIGNLGPLVVETLVSFLEDQVVRPKDAPPQTPEEKATIERARLILILAPFPSAPQLLSQKLTQDPPAPVTELLAGLLDEMTGRMDSGTINRLAQYAAEGRQNQTEALSIMINALEKSVTPHPEKPDEEPVPALDTLPARLDRKLQAHVLSALITFIEAQSAPLPNGTPERSQKDKETLARASEMLVQAAFPETTARLIAALLKNPAKPVADALVKTLEQITVRFDNDDILALSKYTAEKEPFQTDSAILLMDALEKSVTPHPEKPDDKPAPALDTLPARLDRKLQAHVLSALITFIEAQSEPLPNGAPERARREKDALARASDMLVQAAFPETTGRLIAALLKNPAKPVADALVKTLEQITARFDNDDILALSKYTAEKEPFQTDSAILLMDALEKSVTPHPEKPDDKPAPALDTLPARLDRKLQAHILSALITFIEAQSAPLPNGAPERAQREKDALTRASQLLIRSRLPQTPAMLVEKLAANPDTPAVQAFADIIKEFGAGLDASSIAELSRAASGDTKGAGIIRDLVIHILSQQTKE